MGDSRAFPANLDFFLDCNAHYRCVNTIFRSNRGHFFRVLRGEQHARGAFMEEQLFGRQLRIEIDARAHATKTAFGEGHAESTVAQIVRGFRQACIDDFANGILHAFLMVEIQSRRCTPKLAQDDFGVLRAA